MAQGLTANTPFSMMYMVRRRRGLTSAPAAWVISIAIHAGLFAALWHMVYRDTPAPRRIIIPEARLTPEGSAAGDPTAQAGKFQASPEPAPAASLAMNAKLPPTALPSAVPDALPIVAVPSSIAAPSGSSTLVAAVMTPSLPTGAGGGAGQTGATGSGAGPSALPGMGPGTSFFGQGGNAYKVVYVVDASASLMIYMDEIVKQMRQSIRDLVPTQEFHIVLAKPGKVELMQPERLVPAIARYKQQANKFLDTIVGVPQPGGADPVEAMRRAFAVGPELIYFLSDGDYPIVQEELEKTLVQLNPHGEVKITTIGFDPSPAPKALLERIARRHGGHFRLVQLKE